MESGDFLTYMLTAKGDIRADIISGQFSCGINDDTDAKRDLLIDQQFLELEAIKEKRKKEFAEKALSNHD